MYPNGTMKALTLSYDDGVEQDKRLVEILNKYHIKATFNLNSGIQTGASKWESHGCPIRRMNIAGLPALYAGHEVAVHSLTHPHLQELDSDTIRNELEQDKINLERIFQTPVYGMAYPYGTFNQQVVDVAKACGLRYSRGVVSTHSFDLPPDLLVYQPTCHHKDPQVLQLVQTFLDMEQPDTHKVFYLWGHSYEFDVDDNWHIIEEFCKLVAGRHDIFYASNAEAFGVI
ncbi:MAG: polysaccharide deacetylase family protein [Treponema sp.]|jgi:peptidoglycan/xylan/chitin deacetylase (PgdA/CDA1 family)|nr:polysaccharide deacetylase family protein [Treponema sp.]